jgi:predicted MFS family arabinose efflux permease
MNTHAVMLEKRYQRHIMSSFHALFSLGGMAGSALGGWVASHAILARCGSPKLWPALKSMT